MHKSDLPSSNDYALNSHFLEEIKRDQSKAKFSLFQLMKLVTEKKNKKKKTKIPLVVMSHTGQYISCIMISGDF